MKMVLDSRSGKKFFARHPQIHQNYVGSGRVKLFQQFRIVASLATDCDTGLSLKQSANGMAYRVGIVSDENRDWGMHRQWYNPAGQVLSNPTELRYAGFELHGFDGLMNWVSQSRKLVIWLGSSFRSSS